MEIDKALNPLNVRLFSANTVVLNPTALTDLFKMTWIGKLLHGPFPSPP
jgi:hypothetical protein